MPRRTLAVLATALVTTALLSLPESAAAQTTVVNPGFESGTGQTPTGWNESGQTSASYAEAGGRSGARRLAHWASSAYQVETYQQFTNVPSGSLTLRVWVRSSGGQSAAYIALRDCGVSPEPRTPIPQTSTTTWQQVSVTASVPGGACRAVLHSTANPGNWINFDDVELVANGGEGNQDVQIKGGDVSTLAKNEAFGGTYFDGFGNQRDPLVLLRDNGMNYARLKVWVNPVDGYNNKARVLSMGTTDQAARHGAGHRLPLLRLLGRPRPTDQARGLAEPQRGAAPGRGLQPHLRRAEQPGGAGHHRGHRTDRQRDQRRDAVAGRQHRRLEQPRATAHRRRDRGQGRLHIDQGDAASRRGRQQLAAPLVVRQRHQSCRAVRHHRRIPLHLLARLAGEPAEQHQRPGLPCDERDRRRRASDS